MADLRWKLTYQDGEYEFNATRDLTTVRLRQIKQWFGPEIGRWAPFVLGLGQGDPDAWASALWIALQKSGKAVPADPTFLDFAVGEMMEESRVIGSEATDEENPTEVEPTPDSTPTPTS